jgi:hypothetical protein
MTTEIFALDTDAVSVDERNVDAISIEIDTDDDTDYGNDYSDIDISDWEPKESKSRYKPVAKNSPIIAIDTEYVEIADPNDPNVRMNHVLCYSYAVGFKGRYATGIIYTKSAYKADRIEIEQLIYEALQKALDKKIIKCWPEGVFVTGHFLRADFLNFKGSLDVARTKFTGIRKTIASSEPYGVDLDKIAAQICRHDVFELTCKSNYKRDISVEFRDTMLVAPAGKGLKDVGELLGQPKLEIPLPYTIAKMNVFLKEQPELFEAYAINDAVISFLHMTKFIEFCDVLKLDKIPHTIGSLAVSAFRKYVAGDINTLFGGEYYQKTVWNVSQTTSSAKSKPTTHRGTVPNSFRATFEDFAIRTYHGGRNECFWTGPTEVGIWRDYDLKSCYTAVSAAIKQIDYGSARLSTNVADFCGDFPSFALVKFSFADGLRFPCLPVRTDKFGLCYPLTGQTYCTGSEIEVAVSLGVQIEILQGVRFDWVADAKPIFADFMTIVRTNRKKFEKGSFEEKLWKEIGNSLYGKTAQGLVGKTAFDIQKGISSKVPTSPITNPYFASHITGLARAVVSEIIARIPSYRTVVSVTTDGFLTDATYDELDLSGPLSQRFLEKLKLIDPTSDGILEEKHAAAQILAIKTRGQVSAELVDFLPPVTAKANVQIPRGEKDSNDYMVKLYLNRTPDSTFVSSRLTSTREQLLSGCDMLNIENKQRLNLEPDFKRELTEPRMIVCRDSEHIALSSAPHKTVNDFLRTRGAADAWRKTNTLKTITDWDELTDRIDLEQAKTHTDSASLKIKKGETSGSFLLRMFFRVFTRKELGLKARMSARVLAESLMELGNEVKASNILSSKKSKMVLGAVPVNSRSINMLAIILKIVGPFDYHELFVVPKRHLIDDMLAEHGVKVVPK